MEIYVKMCTSCTNKDIFIYIYIFKSGDSSKITNYRPIPVLSFFSKVFERVMYNHIIDFIDSLNVLYKYQYGFRHKHSTQQAIITLVNKITSS